MDAFIKKLGKSLTLQKVDSNSSSVLVRFCFYAKNDPEFIKFLTGEHTFIDDLLKKVNIDLFGKKTFI